MFCFSGGTAECNLQYIAILLFRQLAQICLANLDTHTPIACVYVCVCVSVSMRVWQLRRLMTVLRLQLLRQLCNGTTSCSHTGRTFIQPESEFVLFVVFYSCCCCCCFGISVGSAVYSMCIHHAFYLMNF